MVSFSCEVCNDTVIKKKLDQHRLKCHGAYFSCIDCSTTFQGTEYRQHTSCITEAEKYEKGLYKGKKQANKPTSNGAHKAEKKEMEKSKESKAASNRTKATKNSKEAEPKKKSKVTKPATDSTLSGKLAALLKSDGNATLYKVVKKLASDSSKKEIMKKLKISKSADGSFVLEL